MSSQVLKRIGRVALSFLVAVMVPVLIVFAINSFDKEGLLKFPGKGDRDPLFVARLAP